VSVTGAFVLPPDLQLVPVSELDDEMRARVVAQPGDYALARPGVRTTAKIVDATTAALLRQFSEPRTIVEAVIRASRELGTGNEQLLDAAYPILRTLITGHLLVRSGTGEASVIVARFRPGDVVAGCVIRSSLQILSDTEVYSVRTASGADAVLKIVRADTERALGDLPLEAKVLSRLDGSIAPRLLDSGTVDGRAYLVMEWCAGIDLERAAADIRRTTDSSDRVRALGALACAVVDAYATLHEHGIVHGDVHEGNIMVERSGRVRLVDFGLARLRDEPEETRTRRGGHPFYAEPELARARRAGARTPGATEASDQYALAAALYTLFTGAAYLDFSLDEPSAMRQIAEDKPLPFVRRGAPPWPAVEAVLARALAKEPSARFVTLRECAHALRDAVTATGPAADGEARAAAHEDAPRFSAPADADVLGVLLPRLLPDGDIFRDGVAAPPIATVNLGAAGIAYALYRLSLVRGDAGLLSAADIWSERAMASRRSRAAFYDGDQMTPGSFGRSTPYHGVLGLHVVRALIAHARGDFITLADTARAFERLPRDTGPALDLALGLPGALIGLALVLESFPDKADMAREPLVRAGERCRAAIAKALDAMPAIADEREFVNLGLAHGWAGALYALLRWGEVTGAAPAGATVRRLHELAALAEPAGRGVRWPWRYLREDGSATMNHMPGWCNGSAGFVHLWLAAHEATRDERFVLLAESAGWDAWEDPNDVTPDLCCGLAGRAYAALALYRATGDGTWVRRASEQAIRAGTCVREAGTLVPQLYKGAMGVALLQGELESLHLARMPLLESEGWPRRVHATAMGPS
jgi:serine/threonine-protein kinase